MWKLQSRLPKLFLSLQKISHGENLKLIGWPFIFRFRDAAISLGKDVVINSSFFSNLLGLYQRTIIVARDKGEIKIGNGVGMSGVTMYARKYIEIGDYTLIGANTKIMDNDFHPIDSVERRNNDFSNLAAKSVKIGKDVFIGCNCLILKGSEVGDRCVIGGGAVVSGQFPDDCVIAGNPAKVIRKMKD